MYLALDFINLKPGQITAVCRMPITFSFFSITWIYSWILTAWLCNWSMDCWIYVPSFVKYKFFLHPNPKYSCLNGDFSLLGEQNQYASGTATVRFPRLCPYFPFLDSIVSGATQNKLPNSCTTNADSPTLGLTMMVKVALLCMGTQIVRTASISFITYIWGFWGK